VDIICHWVDGMFQLGLPAKPGRLALSLCMMDGKQEIAFGKKGHSREIERRLRQRRNPGVEMF